MKNTSIQWADSTINPVMGCDGCPLYPSPATVRRAVANRLKAEGFEDLSETVNSVLKGRSLTEMFHLRETLGQEIAFDIGAPAMAMAIARELKSHVRCYAGYLHMVRGANPRRPAKVPHKGHARVFEEVKMFPGRMAEIAKMSDLAGTSRPDSPWKDGLSRLIFVSDMGDALSSGITFEFLRQEIIDVVGNSFGRRHLWLWLTKRPARMLKFDRWLESLDVAWPDNLVAMTSVMNGRMAAGIDPLREIRARFKGLSIEPLIEPVELDLTGINWAIAGGESGTEARPFDLDWARDLQEQCKNSGTAFFVKQLGALPFERQSPLRLKDSHGGDWAEWPPDVKVREFPEEFKNRKRP
jgi:protein gp37